MSDEFPHSLSFVNLRPKFLYVPSSFSNLGRRFTNDREWSFPEFKIKTVLTVYFLTMGECREVLGKKKKNCTDRLLSKNGRMPGGAGWRTSTSFEAIYASSATGISNLVR
jgi:hypothetical protein